MCFCRALDHACALSFLTSEWNLIRFDFRSFYITRQVCRKHRIEINRLLYLDSVTKAINKTNSACSCRLRDFKFLKSKNNTWKVEFQEERTKSAERHFVPFYSISYAVNCTQFSLSFTSCWVRLNCGSKSHHNFVKFLFWRNWKYYEMSTTIIVRKIQLHKY